MVCASGTGPPANGGEFGQYVATVQNRQHQKPRRTAKLHEPHRGPCPLLTSFPAIMKTTSSHRVGQVWHPIKTDRRYRISLAFYGYSVPMYGCYFCGDLIACCPSLGRAIHACETLREEREQSLTASSLPHFYVAAERRLGGKIRTMYIRWASDCLPGGHLLSSISPERSYIEKHARALLAVSSREFPEWGMRLVSADR